MTVGGTCAKAGVQETRGHSSTSSWLNVAGVGSVTCAPTARSILHRHVTQKSGADAPEGEATTTTLAVPGANQDVHVSSGEQTPTVGLDRCHLHLAPHRSSLPVVEQWLLQHQEVSGLTQQQAQMKTENNPHLQLAPYRSSSPVVALWLGSPAATLAAASAAEFLTGEYAAHTCGTVDGADTVSCRALA